MATIANVNDPIDVFRLFSRQFLTLGPQNTIFDIVPGMRTRWASEPGGTPILSQLIERVRKDEHEYQVNMPRPLSHLVLQIWYHFREEKLTVPSRLPALTASEQEYSLDIGLTCGSHWAE